MADPQEVFANDLMDMIAEQWAKSSGSWVIEDKPGQVRESSLLAFTDGVLFGMKVALHIVTLKQERDNAKDRG